MALVVVACLSPERARGSGGRDGPEQGTALALGNGRRCVVRCEESQSVFRPSPCKLHIKQPTYVQISVLCTGVGRQLHVTFRRQETTILIVVATMSFFRAFVLVLSIATSAAFAPLRSSPLHRARARACEAGHTLEGRPIGGPVEPLANFVLVRTRIADSKTQGGIHLPGQAQEKPSEGTVVATGPGRFNFETNTLAKTTVAVGQHVLFGKFDGSKVCGIATFSFSPV